MKSWCFISHGVPGFSIVLAGDKHLVCFSESAEKLANLLTKMCLESNVVNSDDLEVEVPPTRHDILSEPL